MKKNSIFEKDCSRKSAKAAKAELSNEEVIKRIEALPWICVWKAPSVCGPGWRRSVLEFGPT